MSASAGPQDSRISVLRSRGLLYGGLAEGRAAKGVLLWTPTSTFLYLLDYRKLLSSSGGEKSSRLWRGCAEVAAVGEGFGAGGSRGLYELDRQLVSL
ncbi:hypothetical protein Slala05_84380 [Streptomyces lavendulae subsp. lavendulae]|nr:hypothetical protein Slala05_84380 [Streptomyces lavendulae subsp. lavendulae]